VWLHRHFVNPSLASSIVKELASNKQSCIPQNMTPANADRTLIFLLLPRSSWFLIMMMMAVNLTARPPAAYVQRARTKIALGYINKKIFSPIYASNCRTTQPPLSRCRQGTWCDALTGETHSAKPTPPVYLLYQRYTPIPVFR
jgi:hypothetical protein